MTGKGATTHKDLDVWKSAMDLASRVYVLKTQLPNEELYGLALQMRRSAVSIPSNIVEGAARQSRKEFIRFLQIASGSVAELETEVLLAGRMGYISCDTVMPQIEEVRKLLLGLLRSLKKKPLAHHPSPITPPS